MRALVGAVILACLLAGAVRAERDALLTKAEANLQAGMLSAALRHYKQAVDLETKHVLASERGSAALYPLLEAEGRRQLGAADALPLAERQAAYKKMQRLFKGTPLEQEVKAALAAMR